METHEHIGSRNAHIVEDSIAIVFDMIAVLGANISNLDARQQSVVTLSAHRHNEHVLSVILSSYNKLGHHKGMISDFS